ncbi:MCE family protein [uncultured Mycolicibacterium sp.]|uniref:MCE family protein n=1 Tax=uncultured Mycolicibacterium sp. TaxID=2320817 RepID=UPI002613F676|nr:MCE family protein [uncultured Mycolicibacterium sp.]
MTKAKTLRSNWFRVTLGLVLAAALIGGVALVLPRAGSYRITAYFTSTVGLYPGDDVRVLGVPVGRIESVEPLPEAVRVTMRVDDDVRVPADARAVIIAPNVVSDRFVQLTPAYAEGDALGDGAVIGLERTGVPVEWDQVKEELTKLARHLGPEPDGVQGPLTALVNQAADTFTGNGDSFRRALRELSAVAGRLGDSRGDLFGTVRNLQVLVEALSNSNEQVVQFADHLASVSQVLAESSVGLDHSLDLLGQALTDVRQFLDERNGTLIDSVTKLTDLMTMLHAQSDDIEQVLHVTPNGLSNFYNIYNPAQGSMAGLLSLPNFANPVQFICAGSFEVGATPENYKRTELCRQRMAPVLRRIMMNYPPMLFHPINSITAYKGQIIYDTPATEAKARTPIPQLQWKPNPGVTPPQVSPDADLSELFLPEQEGTKDASSAQHGTGQSAPLPAEAGATPAGGGR